MANQREFVLRMPRSLHRKVQRVAKKNNTSMNKAMVNILNDSYSGASTNAALQDLVARLEKKKVI